MVLQDFKRKSFTLDCFTIPEDWSGPLGSTVGMFTPVQKANRPPNPDRLWKKWGMPKTELQDWGFLSCSGLWWSSPQLAKWSRESSACWGHARETWGLLRETGMFAGLQLRPCISFQQAASSIYYKALLAQFKPCLSRALCSNAS